MMEEAQRNGAAAAGAAEGGEGGENAGVDLNITAEKRREARRQQASIGLSTVSSQRLVSGMTQ